MSSDLASRRDFLRLGAAGLVASRSATLDRVLSLDSTRETSHRSMQQITLSIEFSGLCMFVNRTPTPQEPSLLSVLMPKAGPTNDAGSWGQQVPALHRAALYFDVAHLTQGATQTEGCYVRYPLNRCRLDFGLDPATHQCPVGSRVKYPDDVIDIPAVFSDKYHLQLVGGLFDKVPPPWVASRVDLNAGCFSTVHPEVSFQLHGIRKNAANIVEWTVPAVSTLDHWKLQPYDAPTPLFLPTLYPINNKISILIYNVISEEEPDWRSVKPTFWETDDQKFQHFLAYYDFFNPSFTANDGYNLQLPQPIGGGGPNPYTCMLAGGGGA